MTGKSAASAEPAVIKLTPAVKNNDFIRFI